MQSCQGDTHPPSAGEASKEASNEPSAKQQQLDAMLVRLPEAPYSELPLGATIAHRPGHMVACCTCNPYLVLQYAAVDAKRCSTACSARVPNESLVMRLMSICPCNQQSGFSATLQIRRGKWGDKPAVYKIWDLTRDADGIHELFHEISMLAHLQALQVMLFSYCGLAYAALI